jgi:dTDP-4-amino-4,6-dideoxygalactose transaminase
MGLPSWNMNLGPKNSASPEWRVPLAELSQSEDEVRHVVHVIRSGWWTSGQETEALERDWERYLGVSHAIAVSNGTAALYLAFLALDLSSGDEVATPALSFVAATNAMLHLKAVPRFADVDSIKAPIVSAESLERAITPKTRGICIMHYGGYPCQMDAIVDLARKHRIWIVEDAAHAPGAAWNGMRCGKWGDIACFSFFGNKNLTCGEGGLVVTENGDLAKKLRLLRSHGMDSPTSDRYRGHSFSYDVIAPGFNFRIDDIRAALLRVQLRSLDRFNRLRKERVQWYRQQLGSDPRWTIAFENYPGESAYHLLTVVLSAEISRTGVMRFLDSQGVQTSIHYPPIHQFTCYRNLGSFQDDLKLTEDLGRRILTLPLFPNMTMEQVELVCRIFREAVNRECENVKCQMINNKTIRQVS